MGKIQLNMWSQEGRVAYLGEKEWPFGSVLAVYELGFVLIGG